MGIPGEGQAKAVLPFMIQLSKSLVSLPPHSFLFIVLVQLSQFSPIALPCSAHPPTPTLTPTPTVSPHPVVHVHGSFIPIHELDPYPSFSPYPPLPSPLVTVSLFLVSMPLVLFCSFACFVHWVPLIGEIIWYLSFTTWLISLSLILSSSILAVTKGRSSFFLSTA